MRLPSILLVAFLLCLSLTGCRETIDDLNPADPQYARVIKILWLHQHGDSPCVSVGRGAILFGGGNPNAGGTFSTAPRVVYEDQGGFLPLQASALTDGAATDHGSAWLELAEGRRKDLDEISQIVVDAAMDDMQGVTLRDAGDRSNWTAIHPQTIRALEPSPGHAASECAALGAGAVPAAGAATGK